MTGTTVLINPRAKTAEKTTEKEKPYITLAAFPDEFSYDAFRHLKYFGLIRIPISVRFFSFNNDDERLQNLESLSRKEFDGITAELKAGEIIKHITATSPVELQAYRQLMDQHNVRACDIGSAFGKQYMGDPKFEDNWKSTLENVIRVAKYLGTKRARIFSFYPGAQGNLAEPGTPEFERYRDKSLKLFGTEIAPELKKEGLVGFIENEPQLIVYDGKSSTRFLKELGADNILACFDGANITRIDKKREGLSLESFIAMLPFLGMMHLKEAKYEEPPSRDVEEVPWPHVPVGQGDSQYHKVFKILPGVIQDIKTRLRKAGLKNGEGEVVAVLEPHLLAQGRFGGYTGSKYREAIEAAVTLANNAGIGYQPLNLGAA